MEIRHEEEKKKGAFYIDDGTGRVAELLYFHSAPSRMTIYHTEAHPKLQGKGVARELVEAAVKYAREHELKIVPQCPYAKHVIDKTPEFRDVLASGE